MEFKDRVSSKPGRVTLRQEGSNEEVNYYITFADSPTQAGTPLNKATFDQLKDYIAETIVSAPGKQGPQGEKGDKGDKGDMGEVGVTITGTTVVYYKCVSGSYNDGYEDNKFSANTYIISCSGRIYNFIKFQKNFSSDTWFKLGDYKNAIHVSCLPIKTSTNNYTPGIICYSDANATYIGLDENSLNGMFICIIQ